jgi:hypothetical protein
MTEAEWLGCRTNPKKLLRSLKARATERKLRLFACACCRRITGDLSKRSRSALEQAEQYAEGAIPKETLAQAEAKAQAVADTEFGDGNFYGAGARDQTPYLAATAVVRVSSTTMTPIEIATCAAECCALTKVQGKPFFQSPEHRYQCDLVRCIFGNPFRPVTPDPSWQTPNAVTLARTMYDSRDFTAMPLLADLLEEAGCPAEVSVHCRGPGPHVRGCWVVDLILSKDR